MQDLINIGYALLKEYNIFEVKISFKDIVKGWSSEKGNISIPLWSIQKGREYALYYVIHEIIHQIIWRDYHTFKHTQEFRVLEINLLARYNIIPKYAKAYPKALYNREGTLLYSKA
jgi:hypothetical protein